MDNKRFPEIMYVRLKESCQNAKGWERHWGKNWRQTGGSFDMFIVPGEKNIGQPFPLAITNILLPYKVDGVCTILDGWTDSSRHSTAGLYIGRCLLFEGEKKKMTFATPIEDGRYMISTANSGILNWYGEESGCLQQSGIRADYRFITNPTNTMAIEKRFGEQFKELSQLMATA